LSTAQNLLDRLSYLNVHVIVLDDKLEIDAPKGFITPDILESLKSHKRELIDCLKPSDPHQAVAALCGCLDVNKLAIDKKQILDHHDYLQIQSGEINTFQIITYLLSWKTAAFTTPFSLLNAGQVKLKIRALRIHQPTEGESLAAWLKRFI
jgi:hypothetical protein